MLFLFKLNNPYCGKMLAETSVQSCDDRKSNNRTAIKHQGCRNQILAKHNARFRSEIAAIVGIAVLAVGIAQSSRAGSDFLYVSDGAGASDGDTVKRFDANSGKYLGVFVKKISSGNNPGEPLIGPRGLLFNQQGELLVVNQNVGQPQNDTDKIMIFAGPSKRNPGSFLGKIDLDPPFNDGFRAVASALLFGPDGFLYVPITGPGPVNNLPPGVSTGEVRRYNVQNKKFKVLVPAFVSGGPMAQPWYLTFGKTDPATLAYPSEQ
jgi:hypothetical protein